MSSSARVKRILINKSQDQRPCQLARPLVLGFVDEDWVDPDSAAHTRVLSRLFAGSPQPCLLKGPRESLISMLNSYSRIWDRQHSVSDAEGTLEEVYTFLMNMRSTMRTPYIFTHTLQVSIELVKHIDIYATMFKDAHVQAMAEALDTFIK